MQTSSSVDKSLLKFFLLVFVLSVPFWLIGTIIQMPSGIQINIPISSLMAFTPLIAALILTYTDSKFDGMKALLKSSLE